MLLPWNRLLLDFATVMFCCGRLEEEDESMAQGIGRLKPVREKRLTEARTDSEKAGVGDTTIARGRRVDDSRHRADDRLEHQVHTCTGESNGAKQELSDNSFRYRASNGAPEMGIKNIVMDDSSVLQTVEILKRPGQTLGFYIREGNGFDRQDGVFISRIQVGTVAETNGLLHVGDEILTINNVEVKHMSLDDVVILMSIPKKLILKIRTKNNCNKKNASCPALAVTEREELPVVVLKKGRSSSATALEMTEKSPDMFDPYSSAQSGQSYFSRSSSKPRTDKATSSRYASIFISPHKAEAKLLTGEEGDSENSSEASLPRSIDSGRGFYASQRGLVDSMLEGSTAFSSPPISQYDIADREYKYMPLEGIHRKYAQTSPSKSSTLSPQFAQRSHFDSDRVFYDHYSYGIPVPDYGNYRGTQDARRQMGLREILHSKAKYGRMPRSRSPECYNSDSEIIYTHPRGHVDSRGFASDYETYAGAASDDEPIYSIPHIPTSSSTELQQLLQKFNTLSHELQQEQCKLQRQLSARDRTDASHPLSIPKLVDAYSSDDYSYISWSPSTKTTSPLPSRKAAATQTTAHAKMLHKPSTESIHSYRTYQIDESYDSSQEHKYASVMHGMSKGHKISTSPTSSSTPLDKRKNIDTNGKCVTRTTSRFRDLQLSKKPLQISYGDFEFYRADIRKRIELGKASGLYGMLSVHILSGQGLKSSKMALRDLYCVVSIDSLNKARTMIRTGAVNFDWDEAFDVELDDAKEVALLVYNWDPNFKHRLCFHGSVLLPGYITGGRKKCVALKMEPKGLLYLSLLYKEPCISLKRHHSIQKDGLFGVDLETVIKRENSGLNVPVIVRKCIEEVEQRGLEVVGIYRLCGSARRKAQLREAFERNSHAVNLLPENVSDVHVITGVLKDYLRELPEPLFTNALYQMLLDALSVRLPSDPDGSAKLMLSILECLPKANQDTMAIVLNHLKKVATRSDKNKMTTENLAVCFGPLLLCPSPATSTDITLDLKKHIDVLRYLLEIWAEDTDTSLLGSTVGVTSHNLQDSKYSDSKDTSSS